MLYIKYKGTVGHHELEWHVGEKVPYVAPQFITEIQADGDEKDHLDDLMGMAFDRPVVRFYGDIARTVYLNL